TATVASAAFFVKVPSAKEGSQLTSSQQALWIGIDRLADNTPVYGLGEGDNFPQEADQRLSERQVLERLLRRLERGPRDVHIKADRNVPYKLIRQMTAALEGPRARGLIKSVRAD